MNINIRTKMKLTHCCTVYHRHVWYGLDWLVVVCAIDCLLLSWYKYNIKIQNVCKYVCALVAETSKKASERMNGIKVIWKKIVITHYTFKSKEWNRIQISQFVSSSFSSMNTSSSSSSKKRLGARMNRNLFERHVSEAVFK